MKIHSSGRSRMSSSWVGKDRWSSLSGRASGGRLEVGYLKMDELCQVFDSFPKYQPIPYIFSIVQAKVMYIDPPIFITYSFVGTRALAQSERNYTKQKGHAFILFPEFRVFINGYHY